MKDKHRRTRTEDSMHSSSFLPEQFVQKHLGEAPAKLKLKTKKQEKKFRARETVNSETIFIRLFLHIYDFSILDDQDSGQLVHFLSLKYWIAELNGQIISKLNGSKVEQI